MFTWHHMAVVNRNQFFCYFWLKCYSSPCCGKKYETCIDETREKEVEIRNPKKVIVHEIVNCFGSWSGVEGCLLGDGVSIFVLIYSTFSLRLFCFVSYLEIVFYHLKLFPSSADKTDIIVSIFFLNSLHTDVEGQIAIFSAIPNIINGEGRIRINKSSSIYRMQIKWQELLKKTFAVDFYRTSTIFAWSLKLSRWFQFLEP